MEDLDLRTETAERERQVHVEYLRREIAVGLEQAKVGQFSNGKAFFAQLKRQLQQKC